MEFCLFSSHQAAIDRSFLPRGSRHVSHHLLVVHGLEDVVLPGAVVVAGAGLDEHHVLLHDLSVGAFELHGQGGGSVGGAAAAVCAGATVTRLVCLDAGAVLIGEVDGRVAPHHPLAFIASLWGEKETFTKLLCTGFLHISISNLKTFPDSNVQIFT